MGVRIEKVAGANPISELISALIGKMNHCGAIVAVRTIDDPVGEGGSQSRPIVAYASSLSSR
jgi:hypothetical protein